MLTEQNEHYAGERFILVVEDDAPMAEIVQLTLMEDLSLHTKMMSDPRTALEFAHTHKIDLLLLDYMLPGMSGIELYDQVRTCTSNKDVPAIIMSASLLLHQRELDERHLTGLEKPFDLDVLLRTIQQILY